ncbi:MAG: DUF1804 family protein [Rhodospirillaceae bacterium]|nr:DUF1804 family protein [Rhodospirillaceae bacterium]
MAHAPETRAAIRATYIFDRLSLEAAAARHDVPLSTARKWRTQAEAQGDDWDKARAAAGLSVGGVSTIAQLVLADFMTMYQATVEGVRDTELPAMARAEALSRLADAFQKTIAAVAKAAPDMGRYAIATELMQDLAMFVSREFPDYRSALADVLEPFALEVAKKYGA